MEESPVINDSDEFTPLVPPDGSADADALPADYGDGERAEGQDASPIVDEPEEFVPMRPPPAPAVRMPTPNQVLHQSDDRRLDTVPFEFADIRALAQRILKRAQEQGQQKIDAARKQVEAMEKQAYDKAYQEAFPKGQDEGFAKGHEEGMAAAEQKITAAIESEKESLRQNAAPVSGVLQQLADAVNSSRAQLMAQAEGDLLLLALDLAKRLVGHELSVDPEAIKPLAMECIGLVTDRTGITARVNPEDYRVMEEFYPDLKNVFPDLGPIQIVSDPQIERGGLYAATREAEVDMRLATRLAAFEEVILGYSGEAAIAPWSQIPPEAIEAAKQANTESPFSLPPAEPEETRENAREAFSPQTPTPEQDEVPAAPQQDPVLAEDDGDQNPGQAQPEPEGLEDLSELADLADLSDDTPQE